MNILTETSFSVAPSGEVIRSEECIKLKNHTIAIGHDDLSIRCIPDRRH